MSSRNERSLKPSRAAKANARAVDACCGPAAFTTTMTIPTLSEVSQLLRTVGCSAWSVTHARLLIATFLQSRNLTEYELAKQASKRKANGAAGRK